MFNLDPSKLLVIATVMIVVLGPERLPHFARQVGGAWRSFSEFRQRMESEVRDSLPDLPSTTELANYARSPSALLDHLSSKKSVNDSATDSLGAMGDLPPIAGDQAHWTMASVAVGAFGTNAEKALLEAQAPFAGDATLN
jgi:Sec-independent protein translocase protein TatA